MVGSDYQQKYVRKTGCKHPCTKVDIAFFDKVILNDLLIEDQNADTLFFIEELTANIDLIKFKERKVDISSIKMDRSKAFLSLDENRFPNYKFLLDAFRNDEQPESLPWNISCQNFIFNDTRLGYTYYQQENVNCYQPSKYQSRYFRLYFE